MVNGVTFVLGLRNKGRTVYDLDKIAEDLKFGSQKLPLVEAPS